MSDLPDAEIHHCNDAVAEHVMVAAQYLLVLGLVRRLRHNPRAARDALREALAGFVAAGSPLWAEHASVELARLEPPGRGSDELTASERRVARLTASGLTNREVAALLTVSPKTIEAHLTRVYRKLGIRCRAELGAHMARQTG